MLCCISLVRPTGKYFKMQSQSNDPTGHRCHILFVEDNADTGQLVALILTAQGHNVVCVPTVKEALEFVGVVGVDLYLLDGRLPDGDGVELCRQIRAMDRQTPILFFSAAAYERDKARAIEAGADGYMTKPIDPNSLAERVNGLLKGRCVGPS